MFLFVTTDTLLFIQTIRYEICNVFMMGFYYNFWIELQILTSSVRVKFQAEHIFGKMFINILNKKAFLVTHFLLTYFVVFLSMTHLLVTHFYLFINIFLNL